jgi:hypothetical protein
MKFIILASQFTEDVFAGTCFKETGRTRCAMYMWAALQTQIILQVYIELVVIAHPEVSSVVVEHLLQTRVSMAMHEVLKMEMIVMIFIEKDIITKGDKRDFNHVYLN